MKTVEVNEFYNEINGMLGFGVMRLPVKGDEGDIDYDKTSDLFDQFLEAGFNYFDTAHGYHKGNSEAAIKNCLSSRHERREYVLANKLTDSYFEKAEDIEPLFVEQLRACGVDYFDFYLLHSLNDKLIKKYEECNAFEICMKLKRIGLIRRFGISFHDKADVLERILRDHPEIDFVQLQLNYVDYEDDFVQSRKCYEVCTNNGKPVIVMEPVKGGALVENLPEEAKKLFAEREGSPASYAIRFAATLDNVFMVLSGMNTPEMVAENTEFMAGYDLLTEEEEEFLGKVAELFRAQPLIQCTSCRYCVEGCPVGILIPDVFACYNKKKVFNSWNEDYYYKAVVARGHGKASQCIECGACEKICPQHLEIRALLKEAAKEFGR